MKHHLSPNKSDPKKLFQKKSLGQHFLRSEKVLEEMCAEAEVNTGDVVLEIGPGEGTLTTTLLAKGATVIALEKDHRLIPILQEKFATEITEKKLILKEADVLEFDPAEIAAPIYKIVANIPYYITGAILEKFLSAVRQPSCMVLLVQKEIAERIVARDGKESILSISVKAYGQPKNVQKVSRGLFSPPPKVDSAILAISNISKKNFKNAEEENSFFKIVKAGFAHKRKMLKNNLADIGIIYETNARAEELPVQEWLTISSATRLSPEL